MTKEDFVLELKRTAARFLTDGPDGKPASFEEWAGRVAKWREELARAAVDKKRSAKKQAEAEELEKRVKALGLVMITDEQVIAQVEASVPE